MVGEDVGVPVGEPFRYSAMMLSRHENKWSHNKVNRRTVGDVGDELGSALGVDDGDLLGADRRENK